MTLDGDACYRALTTHDARFDGAFFVAVKTTGIYCRPVCTARIPGRDRCVFYEKAALAEQAGFRACFRCRPERAPGSASVDAVSALVARATKRIEAGALNEVSVDELAAELGTSSRHLRRAMTEELGVGPIELAQSRRVALARELLLGTTLPITDVAFASGFSSLRRFNDAYQERQKMTPTEARSKRRSSEEVRAFRVVLDVRPPWDPAPAFAFMRWRAIASVESFEGDTYSRACVFGENKGIVTITPTATALVVEVSAPLAPVLMPIAARVRRMFDTNADVETIGKHLARDRALAPRVKKYPALRVMGAFDPFEWSVRAILGQQVSVAAALTIAGRLVDRFGVDVEGRKAWPDAARLANATEEQIRALGLTTARGKTLHGFARAVADRKVVLEEGAAASSIEALLELPGVGPWTAEYIAMRALGHPDAFPASDLGLRKAMNMMPAKELEKRAERWRPWRSYAATHLWTGTSETTKE